MGFLKLLVFLFILSITFKMAGMGNGYSSLFKNILISGGVLFLALGFFANYLDSKKAKNNLVIGLNEITNKFNNNKHKL